MAAICATAGRAAMAATSAGVRPFRFRHSSSERCSPGAKGRTKTTEAPRLWIWLAMEAFNPATIELIPITVMMPMTTPRMVSPARNL